MADENLRQKVGSIMVKLEPKRMYIILEDEGSNSGYSIIKSYKEDKRPHLLITALRPEVLKEKGNIEDLCQDDYVRITSSNKESETYTLKQPNSLGAITAYISTWLEGHKDSGSAVIYMDKYAFQDITNNGGGLESMRNFLKTIENYIENNGKGAFIVSIDPSAYEQKYHKPLIKQIINIANESGGVKVDRTNTKF